MTCSAAEGGTQACTPHMHINPTTRNSSSKFLPLLCEWEMWRNVQTGRGGGGGGGGFCLHRVKAVKRCYITFTLVSFQRATRSIRMQVTYRSHLHLTQLASQMPELPIQVFFPSGRIKEAAHEYNLISLQAVFPSTETQAWMTATERRNGSGCTPKCFHSNQYGPTAAVPCMSMRARVCICVCACQSLDSVRDEGRRVGRCNPR